jgi:FMN-dependent NADH-azoreductase
MTKALIINSAATGEASVSARLTSEFAARLKQRDPNSVVTIRDVGAEPLPHLTAETMSCARASPSATPTRVPKAW